MMIFLLTIMMMTLLIMTGRSGTNTLGIIFFCIFFGTVLGSMGRRAVPVIRFFRVMDEVSKLLIGTVQGSMGRRAVPVIFISSELWTR
jgi:Na+/H+-dicarboxylate symporter